MGGSGSGRKDRTTELLMNLKPKDDLDSKQKFVEKMTEIGVQIQTPIAGAFIPNPGGASSGGGVTDHGKLTGLADDDHTQYALLAGRTGGQVIYSDTGNRSFISLPSAANDAVVVKNNDGQVWLYANHDVLIFSSDGNVSIDTVTNGSFYPSTDDTTELGDSSHDWKKLYVHDIAMHGDITGCNSINLLPTGTIAMWPTNTAPSGWLMCSGSAVSESTYAALFGVIGHTFGDPGGGNFNLPDFKLKFPVGSDLAGGTRAVGAAGGSTSYTPAGAIDAHVSCGVMESLANPAAPFNSPVTHTFTGTLATIEPPYLAINFIIKT